MITRSTFRILARQGAILNPEILLQERVNRQSLIRRSSFTFQPCCYRVVG